MTSEEKECERCGATILAADGGAALYPRLCIECSEAIGGDFKTYAIPENTGKPCSIKKNYASWKVKRRLRRITLIEKELPLRQQKVSQFLVDRLRIEHALVAEFERHRAGLE